MEFQVLWIGFMVTTLVIGSTLVLPAAIWLQEKITGRGPERR